MITIVNISDKPGLIALQECKKLIIPPPPPTGNSIHPCCHQNNVYGVRDQNTFEILTGSPVWHRAALAPYRSASLSYNVLRHIQEEHSICFV